MLAEPNCSKRNCIHFQGIRGDNETEQVPVCAAFPNGIPRPIAYGTNLHTTPYEDDNGIQFEEDTPDKFADVWDSLDNTL